MKFEENKGQLRKEKKHAVGPRGQLNMFV